jgi:hypothetical protein
MYDDQYVDVPERRTAVVIRDTGGAMDCKYTARLPDDPGLGVGDSVREAVLSLAESYRSIATLLESAQE